MSIGNYVVWNESLNLALWNDSNCAILNDSQDSVIFNDTNCAILNDSRDSAEIRIFDDSFGLNWTNQSINSTDYSTIENFQFIWSAVLTCLSFMGAILNISIIRYGMKLRTITGDLTHSFVCSMAAADLLLCCFAQPLEFVIQCLSLAGIGFIPDWICRFQHMSNWLGFSASGMSLTLLNLDKLIFFKWPLHYGSINADRTAKYSISISWLVCCLGTVPMVVPGILVVDETCFMGSISIELYIFYTLAFGLLPVLSSALVSAYLARLVRKMTRQATDSNTQQRLRAMAYIFITTTWTVLALTPFRIFNILRLYYQEDWDSDQYTTHVVTWMGSIFFMLLTLNPSMDAFITLLTYAPYKNRMRSDLKSFKKFACKSCKKGKQDHIDWV